jgi:5-oxoprolinase (ATP-hydrolysing)
MTNTRITDPEILERRYPVRLERFSVRRGSGGTGTHRGGDGIERVIRFLAPMSVSVLTQRRVHGPRGLGDGEDGSPGEQSIRRADGRVQPLAPIDGVEVQEGDTITMHTPGGGGWRPPAPRTACSQS